MTNTLPAHRELSERECFMLEAALQHGFTATNDEATEYRATQESIVALMQNYRSSDELAFSQMGLPEFITDLVSDTLPKLEAQWTSEGGPAVTYGKVADILTDALQEVALQAIMNKVELINNLAVSVHAMNVKAGWWNNIKTGEDLHGIRNPGELLALKHSEVSEAAEAFEGDAEKLIPLLLETQQAIIAVIAEQDFKKDSLLAIHSSLSRAMEYKRKGNKPDDKLTHRPGFRVELIDALIRILDTLGSDYREQRDHPAGTLFMEKVEFNRKRPDHQTANRLRHDGKTF